MAHLVHERGERDLTSWLAELAGCLDKCGSARELLAASVEAGLDRVAQASRPINAQTIGLNTESWRLHADSAIIPPWTTTRHSRRS